MNGKTWGIFIIIVVAVFGGMIYLSSKQRLDISDISNEQALSVLTAESRNGEIADHTLGANDPKVIIIEYGDYQCSGCATVAPQIKAAAEKHKDHIQLIFRNYPIPGHTNARAAAAVVEAAGFQGKFWEMHTLVYERQSEWSNSEANNRSDIFLGYAEELGLNKEKFLGDIAEKRITQKINFDVALGKKQSVSATPTIFINGQKSDLKDINGEIEQALKNAGVEIDSQEVATE